MRRFALIFLGLWGVSAWGSNTVLAAEVQTAGAETAEAQTAALLTPEEIALQKHDEAIDKLRHFLVLVQKKDPKSTREADLRFRLAELLWVKAKNLRLAALSAWDNEEATDSEQESLQAKPEDSPIWAASVKVEAEVLDQYDALLRDFPEYSRRDEVLFNLGTVALARKERNRALRAFRRLAMEGRRADLRADAWLQIGEDFFAKGDLTGAEEGYRGAIAANRLGASGLYAQYKFAWCAINRSKYTLAITRFGDVLQAQKEKAQAQTGEAAGDVSLLDETLRDMVRAYVHLEDVEGAYKNYRKVAGKKQAYIYMRQLGAAYVAAGRDALAEQTFALLHRRHPWHPQAGHNAADRLLAVARMAQIALESKQDWSKLRFVLAQEVGVGYLRDSAWSQRPERSEAQIKESQAHIGQTLQMLAAKTHRLGQGKGRGISKDLLRFAQHLYSIYLDGFVDAAKGTTAGANTAGATTARANTARANTARANTARANTAEAQKLWLLRAEISLALGQPKDALIDFERAASSVYSGAQTKEKEAHQKIAIDAALGAVALREKRVANAKKSKPQKESILLEEQRALLVAYRRLESLLPQGDEDRLKAGLKIGTLGWTLAKSAPDAASEQSKIQKELVATFVAQPKHPLAQAAAQAALAHWSEQADWASVATWSARFLKGDAGRSIPKAQPGTFATMLQELLEGAAFNALAVDAERRKAEAKKENLEHFVDTAQAYAAFAHRFKSGRLEQAAQLHAVVFAMQGKRPDLALDLADTLRGVWSCRKSAVSQNAVKEPIKNPVKIDKIKEEAWLAMAEAHAWSAQYTAAAQLYADFAMCHGFSSARASMDKKKRSIHPVAADTLLRAAVYWQALGAKLKALNAYNALKTTKHRKEAVWSYAKMRFEIASSKNKGQLGEKDLNIWRVLGDAAAKNDLAQALCAWGHAYGGAYKNNTIDISYVRDLVSRMEKTFSMVSQAQKPQLEASGSVAFGSSSFQGCALAKMADVRMGSVQEAHTAFVKMSLADGRKNPEKIARVLNKMFDVLAELEAQYQAVVAVGDAEASIAALTGLGAAYGHLAKEMAASPCPEILDAESCAFYRAELLDQAEPFERKADELRLEAMDLGHRLRVYGPALQQANAWQRQRIEGGVFAWRPWQRIQGATLARQDLWRAGLPKLAGSIDERVPLVSRRQAVAEGDVP